MDMMESQISFQFIAGGVKKLVKGYSSTSKISLVWLSEVTGARSFHSPGCSKIIRSYIINIQKEFVQFYFSNFLW